MSEEKAVPPRLADGFLRRLLPKDAVGDSIRGDLLEELAARKRAIGPRAARIAYWRDALSVALHARQLRRLSGVPGSKTAAGLGVSCPVTPPRSSRVVR